MTAQALLFAMLRSVICGEAPDEQVKTACTPELLANVYALANRHDLAHLMGQAAANWKLPDCEPVKLAKQTAMQALVRSVKLEHALQSLCKTLEEGQIPFIPLKGSVLRNYYPQSWMRTSCDIDILVKVADLERATDLLRDQLNYTGFARTEHDVGCQSPDGVFLELHFDTVQERYADRDSRAVLARVWEESRPVREGAFHMVMSDTMFYYYHMAHMAKHFTVGGCGIRALLDTWLLNHKTEFNGEARRNLLQQGGLDKFALAMEKLAEAWFSGVQADEMTQRTSDFILRAGLYGDNDNRAALGQVKMGGKLNYLLFRRVFVPYDHLKAEYPGLEGRKWLLPVYQVRRWFGVLQRKEIKRRITEIRANTSVSREQEEDAKILLRYLGMEKE